MALNPQHVKGGFIVDAITRQPVERSHVDKCLIDFESIVEFLNDMETGLMTLTMDEYYSLPNYFLNLRRLFKQRINERPEQKEIPL